jgi:nucleoside-diphosphate-sugar epimerase
VRVLVTGATGSVGPAIVSALRAGGHFVRTLSLDPPPTVGWPDGVEMRLGDITNQSDVYLAASGCDAIIHLAALLHVVDPPPNMRERYERVNVGGTLNVVNAAKKGNVEKIICFSTIAVYGQSNGSVLHEGSPVNPDSFYGKTKLEAEQIVLGAKNLNGSSAGTVLRLGAVYGPRIKGNYQQLTLALAHNRFIPVGCGSNRRTLVHVHDVARAAMTVLEHPSAIGRIYNVSDGQFHELNKIIAAICSALGRRPPAFSLPTVPVRLVAGTVEVAFRFCRLHPPIRRSAIDKYTEDIAVSSDRIRHELGFTHEYDLEAGWKETIRGMQEVGVF